MTSMLTALIVSLMMLVGATTVQANEPKDKVKVEISSKGLHAEMDPGLYICAGSHLHIEGTVQNITKSTLVSVQLEGKAFDASGQLIGTGYPRKLKPLRLAPLEPGQKAEFDLEFRGITGEKIQMVKKQVVVVTQAE